MTPRYFDAHCHIQFDQFSDDQAQIIETMRTRGVGGLVVGCDRDSSQKARLLVEGQEHLFASVGLHPNRIPHEDFDEQAYRQLADHPRVVAIGECGLDYYRTDATEDEKALQKHIFMKHVSLAEELGKPLIIHARPSKGTNDAYQDLIALLTDAKRTYPNVVGDVHFFVGGIEEMRALTALGFTVSFTAVITFARDYDEVIRAAPLSMVLSETDAPYVAPASRRGQRNDPLAVEDVVAAIASLRKEDPDTVRTQLLQNARRLFALPL